MGRLQFTDQGRIELSIGQPGLSILPLREIEAAARHRLSEDETDFLQYGPVPGSRPLRKALARFLSDGYRIPVEPERLFTTAGTSQGLDLVAGRLAAPGDLVVVEDPTYHHALGILRARHLEVASVPVDDEGMRVDRLAEIVARRRPRFVYTIPVHHNPTGATLSPARREELLALAERHDFLVVADEVYQLLTYQGATPPPLQTLDPDRVVSLGTFSKILAPGVRFGWIDASDAVRGRLSECGVRRSGGGVNPFTSAVIESLFELGLQGDYLKRIRGTFAGRCRALSESLRRHAPAEVTFRAPRGGYFLWVELPEKKRASELLPQAHQRGVGFFPGETFSPGGRYGNFIRLCFAYYDEARLREGGRILGEALAEWVGGARGVGGD